MSEDGFKRLIVENYSLSEAIFLKIMFILLPQPLLLALQTMNEGLHNRLFGPSKKK